MGFVKRRKEERADVNERVYERNCDGFSAQLKDPDPAVRRWAARDIVECPGASTVLLERLEKEEAIEVRQAIFTSLINIGDRDAITGLVKCLRSEDAALRNEAIEAMKQLPEGVSAIIKELLKDDDPDVRIFAVNILEALSHPDVEEWLIDVIESDSHVNVCATAVDLLAEIGTEKSLNSLDKLRTRFSSEPYIQFAVNIAIERITNGQYHDK